MSTLVSTKGRYALRAMADLAENQGDSLIPLAEVAQRQGISEKYLESIVTTLSKAGLIQGQRGKGGGYRLARPACEYSVGSILRAVEGPLVPVACLAAGGAGCANRGGCRTLPLWRGLDDLIDGYLESVSLQDLLEHGDTKLPCPARDDSACGAGSAAGADAAGK